MTTQGPNPRAGNNERLNIPDLPKFARDPQIRALVAAIEDVRHRLLALEGVLVDHSVVHELKPEDVAPKLKDVIVDPRDVARALAKGDAQLLHDMQPLAPRSAGVPLTSKGQPDKRTREYKERHGA